jgi:dTMP kinase
LFISFEGVEGCGKSTQALRLASSLGGRAVLTQEPGGTPLGRSLRQLLLGPQGRPVPAAEVLMYFADRAQHVAELVRPSLSAGKVVISDRYVDSSFAYQGHGRGLPLPLLRAAFELAAGGLLPDVTLFLDVPVDIGLLRIGRRGQRDRLESEQREFHERVRAGYLELIAAEPGRFVTIDATRDEDEVERAVRAALEQRGLRTERGVS